MLQLHQWTELQDSSSHLQVGIIVLSVAGAAIGRPNASPVQKMVLPIGLMHPGAPSAELAPIRHHNVPFMGRDKILDHPLVENVTTITLWLTIQNQCAKELMKNIGPK